MSRHLTPRADTDIWGGPALTIDPNGGREMPPGPSRNFRKALRLPTSRPEYDEVRGRSFAFQWFGILLEINIGRVVR
ncbi:MAG: hypothetical protein OSB00_07735 [Sphingomonas bacterium]|nr:hypothetical protein [Sphingomonas bacterium]